MLFIPVDDMGWRDTGTYGSTFYETPNIDKLASQGMKLTNAYAPAPSGPSTPKGLTGGWACP